MMDKYKTFWRRFWAGFVDSLVFLPIQITDNIIWKCSAKISSEVLALWFIFTFFAWWIYSIYFHGRYGQTLGKMALGVKVIDASESKPLSYLQAFRRDMVPIFLVVLFLPYDLIQIFNRTFCLMNPEGGLDTCLIIGVWMNGIWFFLEIVTMLFSNKRRALHDFIAGSVVVKKHPEPEPLVQSPVIPEEAQSIF